MKLNFKPVLLIVLDGFGIASPNPTNAVTVAPLSFFNTLLNGYPSMLLEASGLSVGLPYGEVGNSEVGHMNIGSGQLMYQSLPRINNSIDDGSFFNLKALKLAAKKAKGSTSRVHLLGLAGTGGVHSHQKHLLALIEIFRQEGLNKDNLFLHLFLDGRDTAKDAGKNFIKQILNFAKDSATLATVTGRFYAMDRNRSWARTQKCYEALVAGKAEQKTTDILQTIEDCYKKEVYDEEFLPTVIVDSQGVSVGDIKDNDIVIFFNYRADRTRQLTESFVDKNFKGFKREQLKNLAFITFTEYKKGLPVHVLFETKVIEYPLARILSEHKLKQFHIAETEKYAHVTYFFNGMIEDKFPLEDRFLIPSPSVVSYAKQPEMSANQVTDKLLEVIAQDLYDFIVVNYANPDMVGHTGDLEATVTAIKTVDGCLQRLVPEVLKKGGACFIVGDHGNAEEMVNLQTLEIDKEHSIFPVPFLVVSNKHQGKKILSPVNNDLSMYEPIGILADVAPTILTTMGLSKGPGMKGGLDI